MSALARAAALAVLIALPVAAGTPSEEIGLLLIAIDARRDHLRVSEALRLSNTAAARRVTLRLPLPEDAAYLTVHRGAARAVRTATGVAADVQLPTGLSELAYSYALPAGRAAVISRAYPLRVRRLEIVARGRAVQLVADRGGPAEPVSVDGERLPRWEARDLPSGDAITIRLDGLPVSNPAQMRWAVALLAAALGADLLRRLRRGGGDLRRAQNP
ncbi:MAG TPA: hypothetical protein VNN19_00550 [bacterium]|nr:hypothetical protein [bacterium]